MIKTESKINNIIELNNICCKHGYTIRDISKLQQFKKEPTVDNVISCISVVSPNIWYILTENELVEDNFSKAVLNLFGTDQAMIVITNNNHSTPIDGYVYATDLLHSNSHFYKGTFSVPLTDEYSLNIVLKNDNNIEDNLEELQISSPDLLQLLDNELSFVVQAITNYITNNKRDED